MSNRRKPRNQRPAKHVAPPPMTESPIDGMEPWIWAMQDADEAERRGDAAGALAAVERRLLDPDGKVFWRRSRLCGLRQIADMAPDLPGWVWSRWILTQALQYLDEVDRGDRSRRAAKVAINLRGGLGGVQGRDEYDKRSGILDFDWVYRQLHLYELGGLDAFLAGLATPDLVSSADRIEDWARAPMSGLLYLGASGDRLMWHDYGTSTSVGTLNIGSAARLLPGAHVIGRVVPVAGGALFEGPPLEVPRDVAREVAARPSSWLEVLQKSRKQVVSGVIATEQREWRGLCSDVPIDQTVMLLAHRAGNVPVDDGSLGALLATAALDLAASELERELWLEEQDPEDDTAPVDDEWDGWAHVHAALVIPEVVAALPDVVAAYGIELLEDIREQVAEPARSVLGSLLELAKAA